MDGAILAIDTSTDWAGVALLLGDRVVEENWDVGREGTRQVVPALDRLLTSTGTSVEQLIAIGVAIGPGSFSGLRVGISLAKGLHIATNVPLVGVSTIVSTLERVPANRTGIGVIRAGRSRLVWAGTETPTEFTSGTFEDLVASIETQGVQSVVGEVTDEQANVLRSLGPDVLPEPERYRRAGALARATFTMAKAELFADPIALEPIYLYPQSASN
jgi:tRNA threonylcarbamoyladenosine biosynthesis protein TsaB